jgi:anti-sigma regulatory factor (Ser/Thr protein kinase)
MTLTATSQQSVSHRLGRNPVEVSRARRAAKKALRDWGLTGHLHTALVIVSELVTNAILHGGGPVEVRIAREGAYLLLDVHDDGEGRPVRRPVTVSDDSGHGLELIDGLLKQEGGSRTVLSDGPGAGKTVRVALCLDAG